MTECRQQAFGFQALGSRRREADFTGGHLSSDGGALLLRGMDRRDALCEKLARCFSDARNLDHVEHSLPVMLRQRALGLALGYEDLNDRLRADPLLSAACGNSDLLGEDRRHESDKRKPLAGKSKLNRLELGAAQKGGKYRKINAAPPPSQRCCWPRASAPSRESPASSCWTSMPPTTRSTATRRAASTTAITRVMLNRNTLSDS